MTLPDPTVTAPTIEGPWLVCPPTSGTCPTFVRLEAVARLAPSVTEETGFVYVHTVDGGEAIAVRASFDTDAIAKSRGRDRSPVLGATITREASMLAARIADALTASALT